MSHYSFLTLDACPSARRSWQHHSVKLASATACPRFMKQHRPIGADLVGGYRDPIQQAAGAGEQAKGLTWFAGNDNVEPGFLGPADTQDSRIRQLVSADVSGGSEGPGKPALIGRRGQRGIPGINGGAAGQQRQGQRGTAVIRERAEFGVERGCLGAGQVAGRSNPVLSLVAPTRLYPSELNAP